MLVSSVGTLNTDKRRTRTSTTHLVGKRRVRLVAVVARVSERSAGTGGSFVAAAGGACLQVYAGRHGRTAVRALGGGAALAAARCARRHRVHRRG